MIKASTACSAMNRNRVEFPSLSARSPNVPKAKHVAASAISISEAEVARIARMVCFSFMQHPVQQLQLSFNHSRIPVDTFMVIVKMVKRPPIVAKKASTL